MKYHKLVDNAVKPKGFWGRLMIKSMNRGHSELTDWALEHLSIDSSDILLDVGCGGGRTVDKLCRRVTVGKVYGVDYSELCVKKSKELNRRNILCGKAKILRADVSMLPFESDTFDSVIAVETYYFWPDKLHDLMELERVLKPRGRLMLVFEMLADENDPDKWREVEDRLKIKAVSKNGVTDKLLRAGYQNVKAYTDSEKGWLCVIAEKENL